MQIVSMQMLNLSSISTYIDKKTGQNRYGISINVNGNIHANNVIKFGSWTLHLIAIVCVDMKIGHANVFIVLIMALEILSWNANSRHIMSGV